MHDWSFRLTGLSEGVRLTRTGLAGSAGFMAILYFLGILGGRPVLGGLAELPDLAHRLEIRQLLSAIPGLAAARRPGP